MNDYLVATRSSRASYEVGDTRSETYRISNEDLTAVAGVGILTDKALSSSAAKKIAKKYLSKQVLKKIGGVFLPFVSWTSVIAGGIAGINHLQDHDGIEIKVTYTWGEHEAWDTYEWVTYYGWDAGRVRVTRY